MDGEGRIVEINNAEDIPLSTCPQGAKRENLFSVAILDKEITITLISRIELTS